MQALGEFARSDEGRAYAAVCDRWGVDPAGFVSDGFVAFNLRAALMVGTPIEEPVTDEWEAAARANERAWLAGA